MNIALMGFRGTGKTTICRLLSRKMGKKLVLTDEEILKATSMPIERFVKKHGWEKLHEVETEVIEKLSDFDDCIFDISGGIIMRNENIINLKKNSLVILLTANARVIAERLGKAKKSGDRYEYIDEIKGFLQERELKYEKSADYTIDTSSLPPEEVCDLIMHYSQAELK